MDTQQARITIGQTLMAATAGLMPVLAALVTFVYESRVVGWLFWVLIIIAAIAYMASIMLGGWGIETTAAGKAHGHFNNQAIALLAGTVVLVGAFATTGRATAGVDTVVTNLQSELLATREALGRVQERLDGLEESKRRQTESCAETGAK